MADNTETKRQAVMGAYSSAAWRDKVKKMSDNQVIAIFMRLKSQNKL